MPISPHDRKIEPPDNTEIWRFLKMAYFCDLMANEELYFRRTDLYKSDDPDEGLPTDHYLRNTLNLRRYVLDDELALNSHQAQNRLYSESQYLLCWNIYDTDNRLRMWYRYAPRGVAATQSRRRQARHAFEIGSSFGCAAVIAVLRRWRIQRNTEHAVAIAQSTMNPIIAQNTAGDSPTEST